MLPQIPEDLINLVKLREFLNSLRASIIESSATINNIGGDVNQAFSSALTQVIVESVSINNIGGDITQAFSSVLTQVIADSTNIGIYGDGADGTLSLSDNLVLSLGDNIKRYQNVHLNGKTLTHHTTDVGMVLYVRGTLYMESGSIRSLIGTHMAGFNGIFGGGDGGDGGGQSGAIYVYAKRIEGAGQIGGGWDGVDGGDGAVSGGLTNGGSGTVDGVAMYIIGFAHQSPQVTGGKTSTAPGYQFNQSIGGAGGTGHTAITNITRTCRDYMRYSRLPTRIYGELSVVNDPFHWTSAAGAGASSGTDDNNDGVNRSSNSGGGAGGGAGLGTGGAGGNGGQGFIGVNPGAGGAGGGGGSGGGGALTVVQCNAQVGGLIVSAKGGNGGRGGDTYLFEAKTWSPGGGGGGGGGGGVAVFMGPGNSTVTVTADGGVGGDKGQNDGNSLPCTDGADGSVGMAHNVLGV
jgi:hypothetical protein